MKANIHPQYFDQAQIVCVCGNRFTTGSTRETIHVELCSNCHPFYTGEQRFADTASRIQKYQTRMTLAEQYKKKVIKKKEQEKAKEEAPKTLREMLASLK